MVVDDLQRCVAKLLSLFLWYISVKAKPIRHNYKTLMFLTIEHKNVTEKLTAFLWFEPQTTCVEIKRGNEPNSNKKASQTNKHQVFLYFWK